MQEHMAVLPKALTKIYIQQRNCLFDGQAHPCTTRARSQPKYVPTPAGEHPGAPSTHSTTRAAQDRVVVPDSAGASPTYSKLRLSVASHLLRTPISSAKMQCEVVSPNERAHQEFIPLLRVATNSMADPSIAQPLCLQVFYAVGLLNPPFGRLMCGASYQVAL